MSIGRHAGNIAPPRIVSPETMYRCIRDYGIIPFFENRIPGCSIEEMTAPGFWFDGDEDTLGPWDWKIHCVQSGDIAYGKFLWGGKAAFATVEWYRELMNWRRSQPKYQPDEAGRQIMDYLEEHGSIGIKEVRALLGVKKSAADAAITRLQMQCRVLTGDISRVYRGDDLHYNGWQVSSFCTPEALFGEGGIPGPGGFPFADDNPLETSNSPEESREALVEHFLEFFPGTNRETILKML